ncbi:hypothetical protein N9827_00400 [bacterium]|jgi:hypothetical protein|nr:hypothetical protein [bacterium]|tara:strand:+ start:2883 stop:3278 length:396 start_codon:yes stop_codon:yes gene_type:complete
MRFKLHTLVDITETNTRRGEDPVEYRQQQNYLTVMQTIGMRVNPTYIKAPSITNEVPSKLGLGSMFNTKQKVWTYEFDIDYEGAIDVPTLVNDFDLIPIITKLNETAKFDNSQFLTKNLEKSNIIFMLMDK